MHADGSLNLLTLLACNLRYRWADWRRRQMEGETWTRLRALWEGR